ncbi:MAG: hypothetical protein AAGC55_24280, partial [Myxococcota bacterium]
GCAPAAVSEYRFANSAPVWRVDDRRPVAKPTNPGFAKLLYFFDRFAVRRLTRTMELRAPRHAANVNSVDEVPDSTWFRNRIGMHPLGPDAIARGPGSGAGRPDLSEPLTITGTKVGGVTVGFLAEDRRGVKYLIKFDRQGLPEIETGANVVIQRLMWAAGFHVPEDDVITLRRDQMILAEDAEVADTFGNTRPMTEDDLERALTRVDRSPDGSYRALASKFLAGVPLGGVSPEGVRADDPNDVVPHEERRELRGQYVLFSWVGHTDVKFDNMLDMWIEDPRDPRIRYVKHYLVDFGNGLGTLGVVENRDNDGFAYSFDLEYMARSLVAVGLWRRPWEGVSPPPLVGVGRIDAEHFQPGSWRPQFPWTPFNRRDRHDGLWGAKIVARFSPAHIRAAVRAGAYSDPRTTEYIVQTLIDRRDKIIRYWFYQVTPIDRPEMVVVGSDAGVVGGAGDGVGNSAAEVLCFRDLALTYGLTAMARPSYRVRLHDFHGRALAAPATVYPEVWPDPTPGPDRGRVCTPALTTGRDAEGYTIVKITPSRTGAAVLPV